MVEHFKGPVHLIKAAWGGHSLVKLFRSSSAGMPSEEEKRKKKAPLPTMADITGNVGAVRTDILIDKAAEKLRPTWQKILEQWQKTGSDHGYDHLGSAIWHLRTGKAFGQSMLELLEG